MEVEIEVRIFVPVRVIKTQWDLYELPAKRREERQSLAQQGLDVAARDRAAGARALVQDPEAADVARLPIRLQGQELVVQARQLSQTRHLIFREYSRSREAQAVTAASTGASS